MAGSNPSSQSSRSVVKKSASGRPSKYSPEIHTKLVAAFANSFTVDQAVVYAGISKQTYYDWGERMPGFLDEMAAAKEAPTMKAKQIVVGAVNAGDVETAKWWLKNKASDEFGAKPAEMNVGVAFINVQAEQKQKYDI